MYEDNSELIENLNPFKNGQSQHLKLVKAKWAYGININELYNKTINPAISDCEIYFVKTKELIRKSDFLKVTSQTLFDRNETSMKRMSEILERWKKELFIDPPTIYPCPFDNTRVAFEDGRHRTIVAYHLNELVIPVAVDNTHFYKVKSLLTSLEMVNLQKKRNNH
jgi:hypothetical protein